MTKLTFPAWFSDPKGEKSMIFAHESDVPKGWTSGTEKITVEDLQAPADKPKKSEKTEQVSTVEVDTDGHTFDPEIHTGTKTKTGLWRMKVGVKRPEPVQHDL